MGFTELILSPDYLSTQKQALPFNVNAR